MSKLSHARSTACTPSFLRCPVSSDQLEQLFVQTIDGSPETFYSRHGRLCFRAHPSHPSFLTWPFDFKKYSDACSALRPRVKKGQSVKVSKASEASEASRAPKVSKGGIMVALYTETLHKNATWRRSIRTLSECQYDYCLLLYYTIWNFLCEGNMDSFRLQ